ncbi:FHA domain-containing protein [Nocardia crassostreae]|uniref:FHA domain-containing protein n=1 Tax=Nocardia crassostreae TaxID=53428 RepID=UPI0008361954|nr:FHA domain-containing protein [Nocardia crassostreae]
MGRISTTVGLARGDGLVARFGNVVIFLAGESPSTERVLGAAETASSAGDPGVAIAQRLAAAVFSSGSAHPPAFGVVAPTSGGILVLLRGPVRAIVDGPEGTRQLSGVRAMTWADEILRDPVRRLTIAADTRATTEIPHTDLRAGVAAAGGFILHAPPTGVTVHSRTTSSSIPKPVPPPTDPAVPTPDMTRRAPIPTPSHTRFTPPTSETPPPEPAVTRPESRLPDPPESPSGPQPSPHPQPHSTPPARPQTRPTGPNAPPTPSTAQAETQTTAADAQPVEPSRPQTPATGWPPTRPESPAPGSTPGRPATSTPGSAPARAENPSAAWQPARPETPAGRPGPARFETPAAGRQAARSETPASGSGPILSKGAAAGTAEAGSEGRSAGSAAGRGGPAAAPVETQAMAAADAEAFESAAGGHAEDLAASAGAVRPRDPQSEVPTVTRTPRPQTPDTPEPASDPQALIPTVDRPVPSAQAWSGPVLSDPPPYPSPGKKAGKPPREATTETRMPGHPASQPDTGAPQRRSGSSAGDSGSPADPANDPLGVRKTIPAAGRGSTPPRGLDETRVSGSPDVPRTGSGSGSGSGESSPDTALMNQETLKDTPRGEGAAGGGAAGADEATRKAGAPSQGGGAAGAERAGGRAARTSAPEPDAPQSFGWKPAKSTPGEAGSPAGQDRPDPDAQPPTAAFDAEAAAFEDVASGPQRAAGPAAQPVTGALTTSDGSVYPLDRPYVVGRDPMIDDAVRRAMAAPIVIPRNRHVSRVHAYVYVEGGTVFVRDAATPGGTFVAAPGAADWIRVGQRPIELKPGWSVRIGQRILTYRADPGRRYLDG